MSPKKIVVIGLGPGSPDALSLGALRALRHLGEVGAPIYLRTMRHPTVSWLTSEEGVEFTGAFDQRYEVLDSFEAVYGAIVDELLARSDAHDQIGYAVPGHPSFAERTVELLQARAPTVGVQVELIGSVSYLDAVLEGEAGASSAPIRILNALDIIQASPLFTGEVEPLDPASLHVICQVYDRAIASELKIALLEYYPPESIVVIVTAAGVAESEARTQRELSRLDHVGVEFDHLTTVLLRPLQHPELYTGYRGLVYIMARLRDPAGGCPWDLEQTTEKLARYLIEEAYEVLEAVEAGDPHAYAEELGDLLLQVVFRAQLAREGGEFGMGDVLREITAKLVRRHPHVFGDVEARDAEQVLVNWAAIKRQEKGYEERTSILDGVPKAMPALMRAQEISLRAAKAGFEWDTIEGVFDKLAEEVAELRTAIRDGDDTAIRDELGDLLFTVVNLARFRGVQAEEALAKMVERFMRRFRLIEEHAASEGRALTDLAQPEMERVWRLAKRG